MINTYLHVKNRIYKHFRNSASNIKSAEIAVQWCPLCTKGSFVYKHINTCIATELCMSANILKIGMKIKRYCEVLSSCHYHDKKRVHYGK